MTGKATLEAFKYKRGELLVLDQLLLPGKHEYVEVTTVEDGWSVINKMQVCVYFYIFMQTICCHSRSEKFRNNWQNSELEWLVETVEFLCHVMVSEIDSSLLVFHSF